MNEPLPPANDCDFARSFLSWTSERVHHTPRLQVEALAYVEWPGPAARTLRLALSAPCVGETMYAPRDLIQLPVYEFAMVHASDGRFLMLKTYADPARDLREEHRVGERMTTHDGRGAAVREMTTRLARAPAATELTTHAAVRVAIADGRRLNGRTELVVAAGARVVLDYPVKVANVSHMQEQWQLDAGSLLLPLPGALVAGGAADVAALAAWRVGYLVANDWDWAEFAPRAASRAERPEAASCFAGRVRVACRNRLFALE